MTRKTGFSSDKMSSSYIAAALSEARSSISSGRPRAGLAQLLELAALVEGLGQLLEGDICEALTACSRSTSCDAASAEFLYAGACRAVPTSAELAAARGSFLHRVPHPAPR